MYITDLKVNNRGEAGYAVLYLSYKDIKTIADVFSETAERDKSLAYINTDAFKDVYKRFTRLQTLVKTGDLDFEAEGLIK